ncbi:MAG: hypothetical protein JXB14_02515 [Candidatus Altiarchaeota archaeon]|nr:hypothetical protein [Candidatus Altiarchaeota archaeon]
MLILIGSLVIGVALGYMYYNSYGTVVESVLVGFLLFVAIETIVRSITNKKLSFWSREK